jgi:hypothetical protein
MYWRNGKQRAAWVIGPILTIALLPIACGSDQSPEVSAISKAEFLAKARSICKKGDAKINREYSYWAERARFHRHSEEFMDKMVAKVVLPMKVRQVREMRALGLPTAGKKKLAAFLAAMEEGLETGRREPARLRVGEYAFQRAFEMADSVGLHACFFE